jgi:hypothetical protein
MITHAVMLKCDQKRCSRSIVFEKLAAQNDPYGEARKRAQLHGWLHSERHGTHFDWCPDHVEPHSGSAITMATQGDA